MTLGISLLKFLFKFKFFRRLILRYYCLDGFENSFFTILLFTFAALFVIIFLFTDISMAIIMMRSRSLPLTLPLIPYSIDHPKSSVL